LLFVPCRTKKNLLFTNGYTRDKVPLRIANITEIDLSLPEQWAMIVSIAQGYPCDQVVKYEEVSLALFASLGKLTKHFDDNKITCASKSTVMARLLINFCSGCVNENRLWKKTRRAIVSSARLGSLKSSKKLVRIKCTRGCLCKVRRSKSKGVTWDKNKQKWKAYITSFESGTMHLGYFSSEVLAVGAVNAHACNAITIGQAQMTVQQEQAESPDMVTQHSSTKTVTQSEIARRTDDAGSEDISVAAKVDGQAVQHGETKSSDN
jgi:hypothetical protein